MNCRPTEKGWMRYCFAKISIVCGRVERFVRCRSEWSHQSSFHCAQEGRYIVAWPYINLGMWRARARLSFCILRKGFQKTISQLSEFTLANRTWGFRNTYIEIPILTVLQKAAESLYEKIEKMNGTMIRSPMVLKAYLHYTNRWQGGTLGRFFIILSA